MKRHLSIFCIIALCAGCATEKTEIEPNPRGTGYRGIWHADTPSDDEYRYIYYSGGLGTSTAKHIPLAYYAEDVNRTFFCWGGKNPDNGRLRLMISYYDHATQTVPRPTILMEKDTEDHHDNPALMIDQNGHIWVFVSAHGQVRHAYIYRSAEPYDISSFELVEETNFSYPQPWYVDGHGFLFLHTRYIDGRNLYWMTSPDGVAWSEPHLLAAMDEGHYQISWRNGGVVGTAFNYHPSSELGGNWDDPEKAGADHAASGTNNRTNLYYMYTDDFGESWKAADGTRVETPLTESESPALVHDYQNEGLLVYLKDMAFDSHGNPVLLYVTSRGSASGPDNDPRTWMTAHWNGKEWITSEVTTSDNNYDMGSIRVDSNDLMRIIAPTGDGPQAYNAGGEMVLWISRDRGESWSMNRRITSDSPFNHSYARKPVDASDEFAVFWADGDGREPSASRIYFSDMFGRHVYILPENMTEETMTPEEYSQP